MAKDAKGHGSEARGAAHQTGVDAVGDSHRTLTSQGFYPYREAFPWGNTPGYKNDAGQHRFVDQGQIKTPSQMLTTLKSDWRPASRSGQDYFVSHMEHDLKGLKD